MGVANISGNILTDSGASLSSYLPLTGGTLTGALNGTSATFSGNSFLATSSGDVGVGTSTPNLTAANRKVIDINGTTESLISFSSGGTNKSYIFNDGTNLIMQGATLKFQTGFTDRLTIASTGAATFSSSVTAGGDIATTGSYIHNGNGSSPSFVMTNTLGNRYELYPDASAFRIYNRTTSTYPISILNNGNVGIGTSSPNSLASTTNLVVRGLTGGSTALIQSLSADAGCSVSLYSGASSSDDPAIIFQKNLRFGSTTDTGLGGYTERMRITSGGQVLVNKTSTLDSSRKIDVDGNYYSSGSGAGYFWENRSNAANHYGWYTSSGTIYLWNGSANAASINPSTGAYTALNPSDIRIKDNVRNYNKGLNELLQINVKEWEYNGKAGTFVGEKGVGFIANELEQVIPEWVGEFETFLNAEDEEKTKLKNININELPYMMLKAIQEQQEIINQLSAKVTALENK